MTWLDSVIIFIVSTDKQNLQLTSALQYFKFSLDVVEFCLLLLDGSVHGFCCVPVTFNDLSLLLNNPGIFIQFDEMCLLDQSVVHTARQNKSKNDEGCSCCFCPL